MWITRICFVHHTLSHFVTFTSQVYTYSMYVHSHIYIHIYVFFGCLTFQIHVTFLSRLLQCFNDVKSSFGISEKGPKQVFCFLQMNMKLNLEVIKMNVWLLQCTHPHRLMTTHALLTIYIMSFKKRSKNITFGFFIWACFYICGMQSGMLNSYFLLCPMLLQDLVFGLE